MNQYETQADIDKRNAIMAKLTNIIREWIVDVGRKDGKDACN